MLVLGPAAEAVACVSKFSFWADAEKAVARTAANTPNRMRKEKERSIVLKMFSSLQASADARAERRPWSEWPGKNDCLNR